MYQVNHTIAIDNEITALADDFRGIGELIDVCDFHDVRVGVGVKENYLTIYTDPTDYDTAASVVQMIEDRAPVFPELQEV